MRPSSFGWIHGAVFAAALALAACSSDTPPSNTATCTPACRDGFTCVSGTCVSACNPACGATETCVVQGGAAMCRPGVAPDASGDDVVDATTPDDTTQPPDVAPPMDGDQSDAQPPMDAAPPTDSTPPTDMGPADGGRPPCGMTGQPCCNARVCSGNNVCNTGTMRCEAFTPEMDECSTTGSCPSGRVCGFGASCSGGARSCLRCIMPSTGRPTGSACNSGADCATGICLSGLCVTGCALGATGDAACRALNPRGACSEFTSRSFPPDGGVAVTSTLGACAVTCTRNGDCPSGQTCGLTGQSIPDNYLLTCRPPFGMLAVGAACRLNPRAPDGGTTNDPAQYCLTGQPWQCVADSSSMTETMGHCTTICATDADCPSVLPHCREFRFNRPSFPATMTTVPIRLCDR